MPVTTNFEVFANNYHNNNNNNNTTQPCSPVKNCTKCCEEKAFTFYHKNSKAKDGMQSWCKECKRTYQIKGKGKAKAKAKAKALDLRVQEATKQVLQDLGITTKDEFFVWRAKNGGGPNGHKLITTPFYDMVKCISLTHWTSLSVPNASVQNGYERLLVGYKVHRH